MWINLIGATATAETLVIRPDECAAPADAPRVIFIEADDLNPSRGAAEDAARSVIVLYPVEARGWASARILARFDLAGATGGYYTENAARRGRRRC